MRFTCGTMKPVTNHPNEFNYVGDIALINRMNGKLALIKAPGAGLRENAPDFDVFYCPADQRQMYPVGGAWNKSSDRVEGGGFLSISVFMPDWSEPVNLTAFPPERGDDWTLVYSRPPGARRQDAAAA